MADRDLNIIIRTTNKVRAGIRASITAVGRLGSAVRRVGRGMRTVASGITRIFQRVAIGAIGLIGAGGFFVKAASDAREMQSKFAAVFRDLTEDTAKWAQTTATATRRSVFDIKAWLATLQDTFVPLGFARDKAAEFAKELVKLTIDISSFNNKAESDVLRDLQSALVGNTETVRKYGIILTDATVRQEAVTLGIAKTTKAVSEAAKVQARLSLIQKGSTDAQGDAIRTADQFANRVRGLRSRLGDLRVEIGNQLIDGLKLGDVFASLTEKAGQFFARLSESKAVEKWASEARKVIAGVAAGIEAIFAGGAKRQIAITGFREIGANLGDAAKDILIKGAKLIGFLIAEGFKGGFKFGAGALGERFGAAEEIVKQERKGRSFGQRLGRLGTVAGLVPGLVGLGGQAGRISDIVAERRRTGLSAGGRGFEGGLVGADTLRILAQMNEKLGVQNKATEDLKNL